MLADPARDLALKRIGAKAVALDPERRRRERAMAAEADLARIAAVLRSCPWPDPASLDPREVEWAIKVPTLEASKIADLAASRASAEADRARAALGILGRLGWPTRDRQKVDRLAAKAVVARETADRARADHATAARDAPRLASEIVRTRRAALRVWGWRSDVVRAREEAAGLCSVADAIGCHEVRRQLEGWCHGVLAPKGVASPVSVAASPTWEQDHLAPPSGPGRW